jgi:signal recognition particle receptor subunit beta
MSDSTNPSMTSALSLVDVTRKAVEVFGRPDLDDRLAKARRGLTDRDTYVVVVGEFKQGKSSLVNALLNAHICPVDDDIATAVPTFLRFAAEARAQVTTLSRDPESIDPAEPELVDIGLDDVRDYVTEQQRRDDQRVEAVHIWLGRKLLEGGLTIVDTPGVGGLGSVHALATRGALSMANAVVFVTDASQELTATELEFLQSAQSVCPEVVVVVTKTDFYPSWRKIVELNRGHLERLGLEILLLPVASPLRVEASRVSDHELNQESGYPGLVDFIRDQVSAVAEADAIRRAAADVTAVVNQLVTQFDAEHALLSDPERAHSIIADLNQTKERTESLRSQASKWNQTLGDGEQYEQTKEQGYLKVSAINLNPLGRTHDLTPM